MAIHTNSYLLYAQAAIDPLGVETTSTAYVAHASGITTSVTISMVQATGPMNLVNFVTYSANGVIQTDAYI